MTVGTACGIPEPYGPSSHSVRAGDDRVRHGNGSTRAAQRTDKLGMNGPEHGDLHNFRGRPILTD